MAIVAWLSKIHLHFTSFPENKLEKFNIAYYCKLYIAYYMNLNIKSATYLVYSDVPAARQI